MYKNKISIVISLLLFSCYQISAYAELSLPGELKASAITAGDDLGTRENKLGLGVGEQVPTFTSYTYAGEQVSLEDLLENGTLMVIFYRGGWCPFCNYQVRQVVQAYDKFQSRKVTPVLVSVDRTDGAMLVKEAYHIPFPVISDADLAAHESFNTVIELDNAQYEKYRKFGVDLETWSGLQHHKMAAPAIFLVDENGKVRWSHVALDFKTRPSIEQLLSVIDKNVN